MTLNHKDTFLCMFSLLDNYWEQNKMDDLGALLGSMNPYLFGDGRPIDNKIEYDWEQVTGKNQHITVEEGYNYVIQFLEKQEDWLNLSTVISDLKKAYENQDNYWLKWLKLFKKKNGGFFMI